MKGFHINIFFSYSFNKIIDCILKATRNSLIAAKRQDERKHDIQCHFKVLNFSPKYPCTNINADLLRYYIHSFSTMFNDLNRYTFFFNFS